MERLITRETRRSIRVLRPWSRFITLRASGRSQLASAWNQPAGSAIPAQADKTLP